MPHAHLAAMVTGVWTWARYSWMTLEALGFQCFTCRAPCPSHCLPEPKPESPSNPQNAVFSSLRQSTDLQATLLVFNSHGYSLSQCEDLSACLLFSSLCEILCLLGKYLPANCFWLQIHGPSWWRALTNHSRSTRPGGATQYLPLSIKWGKKSESVSHSFVSDSAIP